MRHHFQLRNLFAFSTFLDQRRLSHLQGQARARTQKGNGSGNAAIAGENLSSDLQLRRKLHNFVSSFR